jgi:hypothetical protein
MKTAWTPAAPGLERRSASAAGWLYLLTFVTSIPALVLYGAVLKDPDYVLGSGPDTPILVGGFLEVILALACIGTAVVLFPVLRRHNEVFALGFVTARVLEAGLIIVGAMSLLSVVTLRQDLGATAGVDPATLAVTANSLVAFHGWAFLFGPGVLPAVNALCLGYILYRARLVPRIIPAVGLIGAPMLLVAATGTLFGAWDQVSVPSAIATVPIAASEGTLGVWLIVKGFRHHPSESGADPHASRSVSLAQSMGSCGRVGRRPGPTAARGATSGHSG